MEEGRGFTTEGAWRDTDSWEKGAKKKKEKMGGGGREMSTDQTSH